MKIDFKNVYFVCSQIFLQYRMGTTILKNINMSKHILIL